MHAAVNAVIDRLVRDAAFARRVRTEPDAALAGAGLAPEEQHAVVAAVRADERAGGHTELRRLARFEPLFGSYSANCTKKG
jgi:hypothetical protein